MTEDLSAFIRLVVIVYLCASLISAVVVVAVIANTQFRTWVNTEIALLFSADNSVHLSIPNSDWITAPMAYKYILGNGSKIRTVAISYLDATNTSDMETLLEHATSYVEIETAVAPNGLLDVYVVEVER